jgi:beta-mannanase
MGLYLNEDFFSTLRKAHQYRLSLKKNIHILSFYVAWGSQNCRPDRAGIEEVIQNGFIPMITWEPWQLPELTGRTRPEEQPDFSLSTILQGKHDDYIWNWARDLTGLDGPIFFRPLHEMNGNWYPWCGSVNNNRPSEYVETWSYIRSIFREAHNEKLMWVWCPYAHSVPDETGNEMWQYFPGAQEIDWLGLDGYNWGLNREWSRWQSFREIFEKGYNILTQITPDKPIMIAEVGCAEEGGDKSKWIEEAFETLKNRFSRINALVWFNVNKECDWRIESSQKSFTSFRDNWDRYHKNFSNNRRKESL